MYTSKEGRLLGDFVGAFRKSVEMSVPRRIRKKSDDDKEGLLEE